MTPTLAVLLLSVVAATAAPPRFASKYDNVDLEGILNNERLLNKYMQCLLDDEDVHCTPDALELKQDLPLALASECGGCSERQRSAGERAAAFLIERRRDLWRRLEAKYDPTGAYRQRYEADLRRLGYYAPQQ